MQASQIPAKVPLPFANSGTKNNIPTLSQIGIVAGAASLTDGFPPLTFTPLASGGVPPAGADFNGIFNLITAVQQWQSAGGQFKYDSAFSTAVGGYPAGAILTSTSNTVSWLNLVDNNTTNPDAIDGSAANWSPVDAYGATSIALTNANVTLTPVQFSKQIIVLTGALTGNVQLTHPKLMGDWYFLNSTTGAFTVQLMTASGTPITLSQGSASMVRGDGTNVYIDALQVGPATQSNHAMQLAQATGRLLNIQVFNASGTYTPTPGTRNCRATVVGAGGSGGGAAATTSTQVAFGGGGGGGGVAVSFVPVATLSGLAVTVGAPAAGQSFTGAVGGTSSIGSVITAGGGSGGAGGLAVTSPTITNGGVSGAGTLGNIFNGKGIAGGAAFCISGITNFVGGYGGGSILSMGVSAPSAASATGTPGSGPGCGSSGANSAGTASASSSSASTGGIVIIEEFA